MFRPVAKLRVPATLEERQRLGLLVTSLDSDVLADDGEHDRDFVTVDVDYLRNLEKKKGDSDLFYYFTGKSAGLGRFSEDSPERLFDFIFINRSFDWLQDERLSKWIEWQERCGTVNFSKVSAQELWDFLYVVLQPGSWTGDPYKLFLEPNAACLSKVANELRNRLMSKAQGGGFI